GKADPLVTARDAPPFEIDHQVAMTDLATAGRIRQITIGATEERLDAAHELAQAEWLGEVIVGAQLEPEDLVHLLVAGREPQVGGQLARDRQAVLTGSGERDGVTLLLERVLDTACDGVFVLDDEDGGGHKPRDGTSVPVRGIPARPRATIRDPSAMGPPRRSL